MISPFLSKLFSKKSYFKSQLETLLGFYPKNIEVYQEIFLFSKNKSYERLEFLGDAILGNIVSEYLYDLYPEENEGHLTKMRSKIVSRNNLNAVGELLNLKFFINDKHQKQLSKNINGNLLEALIGAIYKDKGIKFAKNFILEKIIFPIDFQNLEVKIDSYKSHLFEWSQKTKNHIEIQTIEKDIQFYSKFILNQKIIAVGKNMNKKTAEENACRKAFFIIFDKENKKSQ